VEMPAIAEHMIRDVTIRVMCWNQRNHESCLGQKTD